VLTEAQVVALEKANTEKDAHGEFESEHPGYCGAAPRRKCLRHNSVQRRMPRGNQGEPLSSRLSRDTRGAGSSALTPLSRRRWPVQGHSDR
jgi:hypothetical protein